MKDSLLILSGGMDSTTLLYDFRDRIGLAVTFDYGSNHNAREIACAKASCERLGIEWLCIPLAFMGQYFKSALLNGADAIPDGDYAPDNLAQTIVPFRNGIMLAVAAGLAESRNLAHVMMANHAGDHVIYPDCRPAFVKAMDEAIRAGSGDKVNLLAPYTGLDKAEIARRGAAIGVDYSLTYSCYRGGERHCGRCATCRERAEALIAAGLEPDCLPPSEER
ncbi:MAG: 7-cyano-7-deazaguanine synthase QueC [Pseudoflavonifractor sp.]|nr:7-cyano-7-deazaguanine synthase QueC [Alloprevotella sp.]MCM1115917.1 7-cyano-7-deazaguanine synthase QueC [Pseudoflavonifractor sp.]